MIKIQPSSNLTKTIAALLILSAFVLAVSSVWNDSIIIDEDPHIGAGYSYLVKRDMRLNPEHPPLAKDLAALPLFFMNFDQRAFSDASWTEKINGQWDFGRAFIFNSGNDADAIARATKIPMILLYLLTGWIIFYWTRKRYGELAGLMAMTLWLFSPTVMAHGRFVTTDVPAAFGAVLASYFFLDYLQNPSKKLFCFSSVAFGIALLMKFSTILLVPFFILIWIIHSLFVIRHFSLKPALALITGFVFVVWPVYFFHVSGYPPERQTRDTTELLRSYGNRRLAEPVIWASDKPVIRAPAQYALGFLMVTQRSAGGNTVYFRGETTNSAGPTYFPIVYLIKEPLPWILMIGMAIVTVLAQSVKRKTQNNGVKFKTWVKNHFVELSMLIWIILYWTISIRSNLNIGVRHLLPVYPFMIILTSGQVVSLLKLFNFKLWFYTLRFALLVLLAWYFVENLRVFPHYLTYFNQLAGGSSGGYRYVVDSNLDWGQDLKRLSIWAEENNIEKLQLDYFGWADQGYYLGERFIWLTSKQRPQPGWFAVSATYLMNHLNGDYAWLIPHKPEVVIGNSIFVYHVE